jgi:transposase-like protein
MREPRGSRGPYKTRLRALEGEIARQLEGGRSARSLARELGCHHDTILEVARRRGIALRKVTERDPLPSEIKIA